jgi:hypothetical protein
MLLRSYSIEEWLATLTAVKRVPDRTARNITAERAEENREAEHKSGN